MVTFIGGLVRGCTQKTGYDINTIFSIVAVLCTKNSGRTAGVLLFFRSPAPGFLRKTAPRSLIIPDKNSEKQRNDGRLIFTKLTQDAVPGRCVAFEIAQDVA